MGSISADDTWISLNCLKNKIPIITIDRTDYNKRRLRSDFIPLPSSAIDAISSRKNRQANEDCEQKIRNLLEIK